MVAKLAYNELIQNVNVLCTFPEALLLVVLVKMDAAHGRRHCNNLRWSITAEDVVAGTLDVDRQSIVFVFQRDSTRVIL